MHAVSAGTVIGAGKAKSIVHLNNTLPSVGAEGLLASSLWSRECKGYRVKSMCWPRYQGSSASAYHESGAPVESATYRCSGRVDRSGLRDARVESSNQR